MERSTRCAKKSNDNDVIKIQQKEMFDRDIIEPEFCDSTRLQESKYLGMESAKEKHEKAGNEEEEDDEKEMKTRSSKHDLRLHGRDGCFRDGLCTICHLTVSNADVNDSNFEGTFSCAQGHLLCHRCIQHYAIRPDVECVLCGTESTHSVSICSRESENVKTHTKLSCESLLQGQLSCANTEEMCADAWIEKESQRTRILEPTESCSKWDAEEVIESTDVDDDWNSRNENRHHQQRSYCSIIRKEDRSNSETKISGQAISDCSRRPIRCPRIDCAINVAFSALTHHFLFDHPEVPILSLEPGSKSTLIVSFSALSCNSSRCLALLLISDKLSGPAARLFNGNQIHPKYRNRLPLPVLAARLHCTNRYTAHDKVHAGGEGNCKGDVIIAWVAGLDIGNATNALRCTIQAVDNVDKEALRSLTYTGPVNSLRTAQRPHEVFESGDCVVLHEGLINHMTSGCTNLNINIIIH